LRQTEKKYLNFDIILTKPNKVVTIFLYFSLFLRFAACF